MTSKRRARSAATAASAVADKRAEAATKARETAADRERSSAAAREQADWRKRAGDAEQRLAAGRRAPEAAGGRARGAWSSEPAELDAQIAELEHANDESQAQVGEAAAAEREAEEAVVAAAREVAAANERSADTRERRAAAAARAEAQQARSAEFARAAVEKFECVPQRLPEKLGFDADEPRDADAEAATLERLTAERERIGPVNLVAEPSWPSSTRPGPKAPRKPRS